MAAMERDYDYTLARDPGALRVGTDIGASAAQRAVSRIGSRKLATGRCAVVFAPDQARGLFGHAASAMSGTSQYRKASFLAGAVDQPLFPTWLQWHERPHLDGAIGSAAFDNEGVTTVPRRLVADGAFTSYILSSYSARRLGLVTTGHAGGLHNVDIDAGAHTVDDVLAAAGTGFLVTEMMGQGTNLLTGDYSRGAAGYWFEGGKPVYPVSEVTIAGNLRDIYAGIQAVGRDVDHRGVIRSGSGLDRCDDRRGRLGRRQRVLCSRTGRSRTVLARLGTQPVRKAHVGKHVVAGARQLTEQPVDRCGPDRCRGRFVIAAAPDRVIDVAHRNAIHLPARHQRAVFAESQQALGSKIV